MPSNETARRTQVITSEWAVPNAGLHADLRKALAGLPVETLPDHRAHITLDMITDATADAVGTAERRDLADRVRTAVAGLGPITLQAGSPIAYRTGVRLDLHPDDRLADLQHRVRAAVHGSRGPGSTTYPLGVLHMTAGYAHADTDTDALAQVIHRVRPGHAAFTVGRLVLVDVRWQRAPLTGSAASAWQITWNTVETIPLDG